ncbi:hypothetical protein OM317_19490, partial [Escherichia albertii]|nr:hypothetical protein [Escherichia albertii]MCZ8622459.1 hypothetical protein [Escherichia albertii]
MLWPLQPPESPQRGNRPQGGRQEGGLLRHQAQFPHTPSGVQGAQVTARPERSLQARVFTHRTVAT